MYIRIQASTIANDKERYRNKHMHVGKAQHADGGAGKMIWSEKSSGILPIKTWSVTPIAVARVYAAAELP